MPTTRDLRFSRRLQLTIMFGDLFMQWVAGASAMDRWRTQIGAKCKSKWRNFQQFHGLKSFFNKYNVLYESQYGFRERRSTDHAILDIVNKIQSYMDKGNVLLWCLY